MEALRERAALGGRGTSCSACSTPSARWSAPAPERARSRSRRRSRRCRVAGDVAQERAVDLELLHGQVAQRERARSPRRSRRSRASARRGERAQQRDGALGVRHRGRLGDLGREQRRVHAGQARSTRARDRRGRSRAQLARRHVDGDAGRRALARANRCRLGAERSSDPRRRSRSIRPTVLGGGDELARARRSRARAPPSAAAPRPPTASPGRRSRSAGSSSTNSSRASARRSARSSVSAGAGQCCPVRSKRLVPRPSVAWRRTSRRRRGVSRSAAMSWPSPGKIAMPMLARDRTNS